MKLTTHQKTYLQWATKNIEAAIWWASVEGENSKQAAKNKEWAINWATKAAQLKGTK